MPGNRSYYTGVNMTKGRQENNGGLERPAAPVLAVGAVVFKDDRVLLVRRGNEPSRGIWTIPGGKVNLGETVKQAAEREILEETGLIVAAGEPVFTMEVIRRDDQGRIRFHYYIVDLEARYISGIVRAGDDAMSARWVGEAELDGLAINPEARELLREKYGFG